LNWWTRLTKPLVVAEALEVPVKLRERCFYELCACVAFASITNDFAHSFRVIAVRNA